MTKEEIAEQKFNFLAAMISSIGDGVISTNVEGKIIYMNSAAEDITGWKANEAYRKDFDMVFPVFEAEEKKPLESPILRALKAGTTVGLENKSIIITRNEEQKYISASCSLIKDLDGETNGVVVTFRDITRLKTLEIKHINEENNFKAIFNHAPVGMIMLNEMHVVSKVNDAALLLTNKDREQVIGRHFGDSFNCMEEGIEDKRGCDYGPKCPNCELGKAIVLAIEHGQATSNIEFKKILVNDGIEREFWFRASVTPIIANGKKNSIVTLMDITERKNRELAIVKSRDYSNNILDQIPSLVWKTNQGVECNYVNKVWRDFTGNTSEESLIYGWADVIHPKDLDRFVRVRTEFMRERKPYELEVRFRRYDGEYRWCLLAGAPYYDLDRRFAGYIGSVYDITERKENEKNLKKYQLLSENANDIILFVDMNGRIIEANKAAVKAYGYTYEELCSINIHDIRKNYDYTKEQMKQAYRLGLCFETVHYRKDGSCFQAEVSSKGTTVGNKRILLSIIRDVTHIKESEMELKKAKEEAEAANRAKSEFLANMSHEIRTPINGIVGMVDLTLLTNLNDEQKDNLITAKACANSLLKIINDILDFSKLEAGKLSAENINFNIKELVEQVVKTHSPYIEQKGLELNYTFSSSIPQYLVGDSHRIRQVLNNLISNAMKFTENGHINIIVKKTMNTDNGIELEFIVSDTGIGIESEDLGLLFRSFSQIDPSYTKKFGGTGLGLAISKQLVEMMGGRMWVESEKGKGSTFSFKLKFKIGSDTVVKTRPLAQMPKAIKPINILLVEDDANNQKVIMKMIKEKGHMVETASNGKEALQLFKPGKYDVILMDIQMPEMDGIEAARRIKVADDPDNLTPIIALTAYALQGDKEKFLDLGMNGYISKPIQMDELFYTLDRIASNQGKWIDSIPDRVVIDENGEVTFVNKNPHHPNEQIIPKLSEISEYIKEMESAIENGDMVIVENIAHNIKVISNKIDANEIKDEAFKIELAARRGNLAEVITHTEEIRYEFKTYKEAIKK